MKLPSSIYVGKVMHHRMAPVSHRFDYPLYFYGIDLDELPDLERRCRWFGYNRFRPVALHDKDYLERTSLPLAEKVYRLLGDYGHNGNIRQVYLVTAARYFNYVFNPVTFYLCFDEQQELVCAVAEVSNTSRERHLYVVEDLEKQNGHWVSSWLQPKEFHVSPFNDMAGSYRFVFGVKDNQLDIRVNMEREGREVFRSRLAGKARPFNERSLVATVLRYPLSASLTFPRILKEAGKLYFRKKLKFHERPEPRSKMTHRRRPVGSLLERLQEKAFLAALDRIEEGGLRLELPSGEKRTFGEASAEGPELIIRDHGLYWKIAVNGDIGFGEGYVERLWDSEDVTGVLRVLSANTTAMIKAEGGRSRAGKVLDWARHMVRRNTKRKSRENIKAHYDLSNEFFSTFLDPSMTYSSGIYRSPGDSLEVAQEQKLDAMIEAAEIGSGDHVLEIGTGWGSMAMRAVEQTGCRVTTVTLSLEQKKLAEQRIASAGMQDHIDVQLRDYRDLEGSFDKIVSIEMVEAVGHDYLRTYFETCRRLLKPGGRFALQSITLPDERYDAYCRKCDWIQKHIFPGGHLPSPGALDRAMSGLFSVSRTHEFGLDYARTLAEWKARFLENREQVVALGFDEPFIRKWHYYLSYCEAGFANRLIHVHQFALKPM